jgi:NAD(P)-dependent dehydrogenase (short-subunit alcohol dehydrogenase family)
MASHGSSSWFTQPTRFLLLLLLAFAVPAQSADDDPYRGKVAIITGSSSGLGAELANIAASKAMKLVLVDINLAASSDFAAGVRKRGGHAIAIQVDLARPEQRGQIIDAAMKEFGRIDYLFNNAGYLYLATLEQMDLEQAHREFEVNYWAYADLANRVIPIMRKQGGGTILNVASVLGHQTAPPGMGHYAATKHALVGLFEAAAQELKSDNIRVFIASPGGMQTNVMKNAVGPLVDQRRDGGGAASAESPDVAARDIFDRMQGTDVVFYPGAAGRATQ